MAQYRVKLWRILNTTKSSQPPANTKTVRYSISRAKYWVVRDPKYSEYILYLVDVVLELYRRIDTFSMLRFFGVHKRLCE
jgi:hypothetical protein